jgi:hypothetical protein
MGCLLLVGVVFPALLPVAAQAEASLPQADSQIRSSVSDRANRLHVAWVEQDADDHSRLVYQLQTASGVPLTPATILHESTARIRRPHLVIDANQFIHLLWQERFAKGAGAKVSQGTWVHYAKLALNGQGLSLLRKETLNQRPKAMHPDLAVGVDGVAYSVWEEGADSIILAKIAGPSQPIDHRRIAAHFGKDQHGYPAVAVDRRGNLHLSWTNAGQTKNQQIVYAMLPAATFAQDRPPSEQPIYASAPVFGQPKRITVDNNTGRITVTWRNQRARGPIGLVAAHENSVILRPTDNGQAVQPWRVVDSNLTSGLVLFPQQTPVALPGKPLLLAIVPDKQVVGDLPDLSPATALRQFDSSVEKLKLAHLLAFSSWSGPPPSGNSLFSTHSSALYPSFPGQSLQHHSPTSHLKGLAFSSLANGPSCFVTTKEV